MNANRDHEIVVDEMLDHIDYVLTKTQRLSLPEFRADRDTRQIVERSLEIISEASRSLPDQIKSSRPEIPWKQVADFGNVLRHTYYIVDENIIWRIVTEDLVPLREALIAVRNQLRG